MGAGRSIGILTILNVAGAALAIVQSVVVAWYFGTSRGLEVFFAASTLQGLLLALTQAGQLGEIFLPVYHRIRHDRGPQAAGRAFNVVLTWMLLGVAVLGPVLWWLAWPAVRLLVPGFSAADQEAGVWMFRALAPLLLVQVAATMMQMLANAEKWFGKPEAVDLAARVLGVAATAALAPILGVWAMVAALWCTAAVQAVGYVLLLRRLGHRIRPVLRQEGFSARSLFGNLVLTLSYVGATQVYAFVLNAALSRLP